MKIGIFDSGLGGLILTKAIQKKLPQYSYIYLGDTKRVPYGNRDSETIYQYAMECVDYLFKQGCMLVIIACNTVSVKALRKLQHEYLPRHYPNRRILGVVVPTIEAASKQYAKKIGLIGTKATIASNVYEKELRKVMPHARLYQRATALLVPFIEEREVKLIVPILEYYLKPLLHKGIHVLILGCTHYCLLKTQIEQLTHGTVKIISQDAIIPTQVQSYLRRHPELEQKLTKRGTIRLLVTELTPIYQSLSAQWFTPGTTLKQVVV